MKKFFLTVVVGVIAIMMFSLNSYAVDETGGDTTQWTDLSKAKAEVSQKPNGFGTGWEYSLKITGITFNENSRYHVYIKSGDGEVDIKKDQFDILSNNGDVALADVSLQRAYELNKDVYCYIVEEKGIETGNPHKIKLPRLNQHSLGNRMKAYFFANRTNTDMYEAGASNNPRKVKVKIGNITDKDILLSIKNGEANCLQKLLDYSKSAKAIYTETISLGNSDSITSKLNLTDGAYYYVYMEMDDEGGKYYPVEDVSLYQALVDKDIGKNLFDYLSNEFKWNIENGTPSTPTPNTDTKNPTSGTNNPTKTPDKTLASGKIPKAGLGFGLITLIIITVGGLIFAYYKCNRLKGI